MGVPPGKDVQGPRLRRPEILPLHGASVFRSATNLKPEERDPGFASPFLPDRTSPIEEFIIMADENIIKKRHDNRTKNWNVSFSEEEFEHADALVKESGLTRAAFTRAAIMNMEVKPKRIIGTEETKLIKELLQLHNNVNQIAKILNALCKENCQKIDKNIDQKNDGYYGFSTAKSVAEFLYKNKSKIDELENKLTEAANEILSRTDE